MKNIPSSDYIVIAAECRLLALNGFKKTYPVLVEADPKQVAPWLYVTVSSLSGREIGGGFGGGEDDVRYLISAASAVALEVCLSREIKDKLRARLRLAWLENDHATIFNVACGFERAAATAIVDYRYIDWLNPLRIIEETEDELEVPIVIEEWIEVLCEPSQARSVLGNRSRSRERRKPAEKSVASLFEGVA
jgi:hypothetical protein